MVEINTWLTLFSEKLQVEFGNRIWFVGLQGSYARGEAYENSDIDMVVILDKLSTEDIYKYHDMINKLPYREMICGFLSGKDELLHWEVSELFQFYYDTKPILGSLDVLLNSIDAASVERAIKTGACSIYHGCVHNMLYDRSNEILRSLYKSASFVIQAVCFQKTGEYTMHLKDLVRIADLQDKQILEALVYLKNTDDINFKEMSNMLFDWSKRLIK